VSAIREIVRIVTFIAHQISRSANKGFVSAFVQKPLEIPRVGHLQLEEPASIEWILVDEGGVVDDRFIDLDTSPASGAKTSDAAFTDSTTAAPSPFPRVAPTSGSCTNTRSPRASAACSVMPTVATSPHASAIRDLLYISANFVSSNWTAQPRL